MPAMERWEYVTVWWRGGQFGWDVRPPREPSIASENFEDVFNALGQEGWELAAPVGGPRGTTAWFVLRRKQGSS